MHDTLGDDEPACTSERIVRRSSTHSSASTASATLVSSGLLCCPRYQSRMCPTFPPYYTDHESNISLRPLPSSMALGGCWLARGRRIASRHHRHPPVQS